MKGSNWKNYWIKVKYFQSSVLLYAFTLQFFFSKENRTVNLTDANCHEISFGISQTRDSSSPRMPRFFIWGRGLTDTNLATILHIDLFLIFLRLPKTLQIRKDEYRPFSKISLYSLLSLQSFQVSLGIFNRPKRIGKQCLWIVLAGQQKVLWYFWAWPIRAHSMGEYHTTLETGKPASRLKVKMPSFFEFVASQIFRNQPSIYGFSYFVSCCTL